MAKIITAEEMAAHYAPLLDLHGALKEVERLSAENERLREALERIAEDIWGEAYNVSQKRKYIARAALGCTK